MADMPAISKAPLAPNKGMVKGKVLDIRLGKLAGQVCFTLLVLETSDVDGVMFNPLQGKVGSSIEVILSSRRSWSIDFQNSEITGCLTNVGDERGTNYFFTVT